jgi:hypothetical protein
VLEDILARDRVRAESAPPLPGVDPEKRQAQIRAEARRERRVSQQQATVSQASPAAPVSAFSAVQVRLPLAPPVLQNPRKHIRGGTSVEGGSAGWARRVAIGVLCASAVAAGVLAAAFQSL